MDESIIPFEQLGYRETERSPINYATEAGEEPYKSRWFYQW